VSINYYRERQKGGERRTGKGDKSISRARFSSIFSGRLSAARYLSIFVTPLNAAISAY